MPSAPITSGYELSERYDDVTYKLGQKNPDKGRIDCSGWAVFLQNRAMKEINTHMGEEFFSAQDAFRPGFDSAAAIIKKVHDKHGTVARDGAVTLDKLKEGMLIGEDNGHTKFDEGRYQGIDHIVQVVSHPKTGALYISQSRGGEGVELTPAAKYLHAKQAKGVEMHLVDPWKGVRERLQQLQDTQSPAAVSAKLQQELSALGYNADQIQRIQTNVMQLGSRDGAVMQRVVIRPDGQSIVVLDHSTAMREFDINRLLAEPKVPEDLPDKALGVQRQWDQPSSTAMVK